MNRIDCRGQACPGPVIQVKKAIEISSSGEEFSILVDNDAARENVIRFAGSRGYEATVEQNEPDQWQINIVAPAETEKREDGDTGKASARTVVFIASDTLGHGDDKLGNILLEGFISSLAEQDTIPDAICLMNGGVKVAAEGSPLTDVLDDLVNLGCELLVCGTCLEFFDIKDKLLVGTVSNMYDIQGRLLNAGSVIRP
jgi:selenium metabolism protein YedF